MTFTILSSLKSLQRKNVFVKGGNTVLFLVGSSGWWDIHNALLSDNIGSPPAVSPSRVRTFQRLESLPLLEHPSANWPFPSHTLCLFLGSRRVRGEQEDSR